MHFFRSRTQTSRGEHRTQKAAMIIKARSLAAVLLLTTLALGCVDSIPTAVEEPATPAADAAVAAGKKPAGAGVIRATFPDDNVCGIPVTTDYFSAGATWDILPGGVPSKATGTLRVTFTAANGQSLQLHASGQVTREIAEWIDDETFVGIETVIGLGQALKMPHGPALMSDIGRIAFELVVQLQEDGGFILLAPPVILEVSGPHPQAENPALFCEIVTDALS